MDCVQQILVIGILIHREMRVRVGVVHSWLSDSHLVILISRALPGTCL